MLKYFVLTFALTLLPAYSAPAFDIHGGFSSRYSFTSARYLYPAVDTAGIEFTNKEHVKDQDMLVNTWLEAELNKVLSFALSGNLRSDLDGNGNRKSFYALESIYDARKNNKINGALYTAFIRLKPALSFIEKIDIGRQYAGAFGAMPLDGLSLSGKAGRHFNYLICGGVTAPLFEVNEKWGSDWLMNTVLNFKLTSNVSVNLDYNFFHDSQSITNIRYKTDDQLMTLRYYQNIKSVFRYSAAFGLLNFKPGEALLRMDLVLNKIGLDIHASGLTRFELTNNLGAEQALFGSVFGSSKPYMLLNAAAVERVGRHFTFDTGMTLRRLFNPEDVSVFNRNYLKAFAGIGTALFSDALVISLNAEAWKSDKRRLWTGGGGISWQAKFLPGAYSRLKLSTGTSFSFYKYSQIYYSGLSQPGYIENQNVRTWYAKLILPLAGGLSLNVKYEYETGVEIFNSLNAGIKYEF